MGKQLLNKNISPRVTRASLLLKNCEKLPHRRHYKAHGSNYENAVTEDTGSAGSAFGVGCVLSACFGITS